MDIISSTILILILFLILIGSLEIYFHRKALENIPIRIHVNGTRGKSSVTRLIAAGLRSGGIRTIAKTTGTAPRVIDENGKDFRNPYQNNFFHHFKYIDLPLRLLIE